MIILSRVFLQQLFDWKIAGLSSGNLDLDTSRMRLPRQYPEITPYCPIIGSIALARQSRSFGQNATRLWPHQKVLTQQMPGQRRSLSKVSSLVSSCARFVHFS